MPIDLELYQKIAKKAEDLHQEAAKARGALEQLMRELEENYGCGTFDEARTMLEDLEDKAAKEEKTFGKLLADYEEAWGSVLEE